MTSTLAESSVATTDARRRTETARLLLRARASHGAARERYENDVVALNLEVAREIARRYHGRGIPADDLDQVACLGLVKAVRGFDPTLGEDFLAFAVPTVRGELRRYFRDCGWTVRPPRSVQELQNRVTAAESELSQKFGRLPRPSEIAVHLGVAMTLVVDAQQATGCFTPVSLDASRTEEEDDAGTSPTARLGDLDPAYDSAEARIALEPLLRELDDRDRTILLLRFFQHRTQTEIGEVVGVSQEQVSRLLNQILGRLRRTLDAGAA